MKESKEGPTSTNYQLTYIGHKSTCTYKHKVRKVIKYCVKDICHIGRLVKPAMMLGQCLT